MKCSTLFRVISMSLLFGTLSILFAQSSDDQMATGLELLRNGAYTEAATKFRQVLSLDGSSFEAQHNLAFCYLQMGRQADAVREFKKAIQLNGKNAETWANLAVAYEGLNKNTEALQALVNAADLDPTNTGVRMNLATLYANQNKIASAIAEYRSVLKVDNRKFEAYTKLAQCLINTSKPAEAKAVLNELLRTESNNAEGHWLMANILWKSDADKAKALSEYQLAIKLEPTSQNFYENLALLQEDMGAKSDAIATWKTYLTYLDDPVTKDKVQAHVDKLEGVSRQTGTEMQSERPDGSIPADELKSGLRPDSRKQSKVIDTKPIDVSNDFADIKTDAPKIDLKEEAKKKAKAK